MKVLKLMLLSLLLICGLSATSEIIEPKEDAVIQIRYNKTASFDTVKGRTRESPMILRVGRTASMFYPEKRMFVDSVESRPDYAGDLISAEDMEKYGGKAVAKVMGWEDEYLFRNVRDDETLVCQSILASHIGYKEKTELPQWTVHTDSLTSIMGYGCVYATCEFRGRNWEAWFTPEIPIGEGPWKLAGLPGLVLKAQDSGRQYVYEAESIRTQGLLPVGIYIYERRPLEILKNRQDYLKTILDQKENFMKEINAILGSSVAVPERKLMYDLQETDYPHK